MKNRHQRLAKFDGLRIELRGDGFLTGDVVIEVDAHALMQQYGRRALLNKSGVAKQCKGAVIVRTVNRQPGA